MLWIHASSAARFEQGVREIAGLAKIRGRDDPKANIFQLVRDWLRGVKSGRWVLVLDNLDDATFLLEPYRQDSSTYSTLFEYLPVCDHGSILITTRSADAARKLVQHSDMISVGVIKDGDAVRLLEKKFGDRMDMTDVLELATELENMPLALTQAAAYLRQMGGRCSVQRYLERLRKSDESKNSILNKDAGDLWRDRAARNSVFLTWQISFEHVHKTRPSAAELLSLMSFCDRQAIPEALVRRGDSNEEAGAREDENDDPGNGSSESADSDNVSAVGGVGDNWDDAFDEDIRMLEGYSFVSLTTDPSTFKMHKLVQVAMRKWLESRGQLEQWKEQYIDNLCALFPPGSYENWPICQVYYPHAQSAAELKPKGGKAALKWATIMYNAAWYAWTRLSAVDAEKMAVVSWKARAKMLGEHHKDTLSSQAMLALTKTSQGRWGEAEQLEVQVMKTSKMVLGAEHPSTLTSMGNLASTYRNQGRWEEAEQLEVQVMETRKKVLGVEHPDMLLSVANLASTYRNQGRWDEAEKLQHQALETRKKVLGEEHPDTLMSMGNLALIYQDQGRWNEAEKLEVQVAETRKKVLGTEHPDTLTSINNLASTYMNQGRWSDAEKLEVQVANTRKKVLGTEHPDTLTSIGNLASTYRKQGRWLEAESLEIQVIETQKKWLGDEHPSILTSMDNLASTYSNQGRWKEAEQLQLHVVEARKKILGPKHPETLATMANLASTYGDQGSWDQAEEVELEVVQAMKTVLGAEHPNSLTTMANLASTYHARGRYKDAEDLQIHVMTVRRQALGDEHPDTLMSMNDLASVYISQGRWSEAEDIQEKAAEASKKVLGEQHPQTLTALAGLALTYMGKEQWRAAADTNTSVMDLRLQILGPEHPSTLRVMHRLALTYKEMELLEQAEDLESKVVSKQMKVLGQSHPDTLESAATLAKIRETRRQRVSSVDLEDQSSDAGSDEETTVTSVSSATSYADQDQDWLTPLTNCLTADAELLSLYVEAARKLRKHRFSKKVAEVLKQLSIDLRNEAPHALRSTIAVLTGSKARRQLLLADICNHLRLYEPAQAGFATTLKEIHSEQLSTKTIDWIARTSAFEPSEGKDIMATKQDASDALVVTARLDGENADDSDDSREGDDGDDGYDWDDGDETVIEDVHPTFENVTTFIANSRSLVYYKQRIGALLDPHLQLSVALGTNDTELVRDLLSYKFGTVASGPWAWLSELKELNYSVSDIAELLLEQQNESPWIYYEPWLGVDQDLQIGLHMEGCVHKGGRSLSEEQSHILPNISTHRRSFEHSTAGCERSLRDNVVSLCGLAGVSPPAHVHLPWSGEILLQDDGIASVTFRTDAIRQSTVLERVRHALYRFSCAVGYVQQSGHCCDSFTLLRSAASCMPEERQALELSSVDLSLAEGLSNNLAMVAEQTSEATTQLCAETALKILAHVSDHFSDVLAGPSRRYSQPEMLDLCAVAVQVLCLGYVSYCQAHVGPPQVFFLQHTLTGIRLIGAQTAGESNLQIDARLRNLTCIGSMLQNSVLVFSLFGHDRVQHDVNDDVPLHLLASPQDIVDTWGPGNFVVTSESNEECNISRIVIGGGCIFRNVGRDNIYHWSPGLHLSASEVPTMSLRTKVMIGASIVLNQNCHRQEEDCLQLCDEYRDPLGSVESHWELMERQAGIQAGQYATLIFNLTWAKRTGTTLKELHMLRPTDQLVPFLESMWGLQVSFCSGFARRVKMRELLSEIIPTFVGRKAPTPQQWTELRDTHCFLDILKHGDLSTWLNRVWFQDRKCYDLACALMQSITMILYDTGIDPSGKYFVVAWIPSQACIPLQCMRIRTEHCNFWTKVLEDSIDCATFAYLTMKCLQIEGRGCRNTQVSWHGEISLVETEVHRHVDRLRTRDTLQWPWSLEHGQIYPIGRAQAGQVLQARIHLPDPTKIPRLIVSPSKIPMNYMHRILQKRSRSERLRERLTSFDKAKPAFIASRDV